MLTKERYSVNHHPERADRILAIAVTDGTPNGRRRPWLKTAAFACVSCVTQRIWFTIDLREAVGSGKSVPAITAHDDASVDAESRWSQFDSGDWRHRWPNGTAVELRLPSDRPAVS